MGEFNRRDLLGAGVALGMGAAATGAIAQEAMGGGGGRRGGAAAPPAGGMMGGTRLGPPVNQHVQPSSVDMNYKPRRINKAIELWEDKQCIYYGGSGLGPGVDSYAQGVRMSQTYMDAINVEMEHGCLDFMGLREFMRGLVDGGPTRSGHRTPAVFVETAIIGLDSTYMRANTWVLEQLLDTGIHGIHMCHARKWSAIEVATQMGCRYPFPRPGITTPDNDDPVTSTTPCTGTTLKYRGLRGSSASYAAQIWGVNGNMYNHLADLYPLNPKGELIFGVKIEDTFCDKEYAQTIALPGISMAEWGPGDHSFWYYGLDIMPENGGRPTDDLTQRPEMFNIRKGVLAACLKNNVAFLNAGNTDPNSPTYTITQLKDGALVLEASEACAIIGREYSKRKMPV